MDALVDTKSTGGLCKHRQRCTFPTPRRLLPKIPCPYPECTTEIVRIDHLRAHFTKEHPGHELPPVLQHTRKKKKPPTMS